ncbi:hypothetical protein C5C18_14980 [Rathayibacter tritici]|uniref:hypothetical protein n=1 Tax=Rathayibacter tritici TaxID=33888 RepID=UPI000833CBA3|nr:hypothetical protein [Rathayibacter tritici]PPF26684.1 hypothetical protein C5C06_10895 [Rathayibacter tritici]PPF61633.1 hypothetical protein C5C21_14910 [Rathayibacter tritici]PPG02082.1 hypothetical protein C5C18_14980 [Rathayibacter tritici]PPI12739.1 hypothetical protein C5D07_11740 [Rathayibacter tritici]PPI42683.1 hypothetical protein C5D18_11920 [Rathayibacter tritici]
MNDQRLSRVRSDLRTALERVHRRLDPGTEVYLRHPLSEEDFALCLDELLEELDSENWADVLTRNYPVAYIVNLDTVMDRLPRYEGARASPTPGDGNTGPTESTGERGLSPLDGHGTLRPKTVHILRRGLGMLYSERMERALDHLLDRLEERFDPDWFSWCREYNEHTEFTLCLETVVDALYFSASKVPALLLDRIHELARIMEMSSRRLDRLRSL